MFTNIVIGIDGRDGGHSAVRLAKRLAGADAVCTLANVYGTRMFPGRGAGITLVWEAEASETLLQHERELAGLPDADILRSSELSVGRGLHEIAGYVKADLLVIGATHRQGAARAVLGDDTASVLRGAPCPVAIAPISYAPSQSVAAIGVAYDGSAESSQALAGARKLAGALGARLQVLAVVPVHVQPYWEREPVQSPEAAQREVGLAAVPELEGSNVRVIEGNPAEQLAMWTQDLDLLVLGTRSQGVMGRLLTGSVARHLAVHSACPLLIWPRSAARSDQPAGSDAMTNAHP